ncbi:MAG: CopG family transcriptional regulator [bacterium]|nr:CopG family transcriptional regulator [bacterium]
MKTVSLSMPEELLNTSTECASALRISRARYIRQAIERMNRHTLQQVRARRLAEVSRRVRGESMMLNAEFSRFETDLNC